MSVVDAEDVRVAVFDEERLLEYHVEERFEKSLRGNIYVGRVVNLEPSIQAAFVDIGEQRSAFLHVSDVDPAYRNADAIPLDDLGREPGDASLPIQSLVKRGQTVLVQITKEAIGQKGPSATTSISLPGRSLVLLVGAERAGVSKKISDPEEREALRALAEGLDVGEQLGVIVRTAGLGLSKRDLDRDLRYLKQVWERIASSANSIAPPALLYAETDLVIRTVRDLFSPDIDEVVVDDADVARRIIEFFESFLPRYRNRVTLYDGDVPIFSEYGIEREIDTIYDRKVKLPSGGSIVIDETEALVAIDVNSGSSRKQGDLERTARSTNLEAVDEIARQLRLRDLGGVVVVDFIDMGETANRREVESRLREELRRDRSKTWISRMSRFGLIEMTRQRLRPSKEHAARQTCPVCDGRGTVRTPKSATNALFRQLRHGLGDGRQRSAEVRLSPQLFEWVVNERRAELTELEQQLATRIRLVLDATRVGDQFEVEFVR